MANEGKTPAILDALGDPVRQGPQEPAIDAPVLQKIGYAVNRLGELIDQLHHMNNGLPIQQAHFRLREVCAWVETAATIPKPK